MPASKLISLDVAIRNIKSNFKQIYDLIPKNKIKNNSNKNMHNT